MTSNYRRWLFAGFLLSLGMGLMSAVACAEQRSPQKTKPHGPSGQTAVLDDFRFEVHYRIDAIRVAIFDLKGQPIDAKGLRGTVVLKASGNPRSYRYDLFPESWSSAKSNTLLLPVDMSQLRDCKVSARFMIFGLKGTGRLRVEFSQMIEEIVDPDELAIEQQEICLVSGKKLGSMGKPVKTRVNGRDVYVCCRGCINRLKKNPRKYLGQMKLAQPPRGNSRNNSSPVTR